MLPGLVLSRLPRVVHVQIEEEPRAFRWALRWPPELIVTCSRTLVEHVRRSLPDRLRDRQRIEAVPNAVDTGRFFPAVDKVEAKCRVGAPEGTPLALMLANLAPHKGQETAIRAIAALARRGIAATCWLAGVERGPGEGYADRLSALIDELGVGDRVRLLGFRADAPDLLRAADLFLLPSTCEGLPLSIVEAQATKVPVLAAPTAGIPEVVADGETGFLIAADDAEGYADRIAMLLDDGALHRRVAESAYAQALRESTWRSFCGRMLELYDLLGDGRGRPRPGRGDVAPEPLHVLRG
jgi:glycosyltransferase involved in cell wall biosynthesis